MTLDEAKNILINRGFVEVNGDYVFDGDKWRNAIAVISKWLEQQPCDMKQRVEKEYLYESLCEDLKRANAEIKRLSEPFEDAISRQAVDELSKELVHTTRDKADFLCNFWEGLQKLPPVTPKEKTRWIPISERLPEMRKAMQKTGRAIRHT